MCVDNVFRIWDETKGRRSTRLIFCDQGVPKPDKKKSAISAESVEDDTEPKRHCVYDDIKEKLIAKGVPSEEIAFIHDAKNEEPKEKLFEKVRKGEIRVLIGSTQKMGAGTNVQDRLIASHDLDAPWKPSDMLVCSISGCSKDDVPAALPETEHDAAQTATSEDEISEVPIEIDIFEDAEVLVDKEKLFYPGSLLLEAKSLNSEFPPKTFSVLLTSANLSTITYEIHVDEEKITDYLAENNYVLQSSVKTCEISVDELPSYLISTELLTQENLQAIDSKFVEMLTDAIEKKNELNSELIEWDNNHADNDFPDARLYDTDISPIARYAVMPNPNFDFKSLDTSDSPGTYAYFVGGLGESQMGAISVVYPLGQVVVGLGLLFGNGAASYISRLLGLGIRKMLIR